MSEKSAVQSSSGGIGLASLLGVTFIILKLTDVIDWSWIWVLSPFWISLLLGLLVAGAFFAFMLFAFIMALIFDK